MQVRSDQEWYQAKRVALLAALFTNFNQQGLMIHHLDGFQPLLDTGNTEAYISAFRDLRAKFRLPPEVIIREMEGLLDSQVAALPFLYQSGFRGMHLRAWERNAKAEFTDNHHAVLKWLRESLRVTPEQAVAMIAGLENDISYEFMIVQALKKGLSAWIHNQISLSPGAIISAIDTLVPGADTLVRREAIDELFVRWLRQEIALSEMDATNAIGLLDELEFKDLQCHVPLVDSEAIQLAKALALGGVKRGDVTIAARLGDCYELDYGVLHDAMMRLPHLPDSFFSDTMTLAQLKKFITHLTMYVSQSATITESKVGDHINDYENVLNLANKINGLMSKAGFSREEATLFALSDDLRDLVLTCINSPVLMKVLANAGEASLIIHVDKQPCELPMIKLHSMIEKYLFKPAARALDDALSAYLVRNQYAFYQHTQRADSLRQAAGKATTRSELKALVDYQFGLMSKTLPPSKIKGEQKHELPLRNAVDETDDYYETIKGLYANTTLSN